MPFFAASEAPPRPESMKFPVFSLLAGNLAFSETSSQWTAPSSGESANPRSLSRRTIRAAAHAWNGLDRSGRIVRSNVGGDDLSRRGALHGFVEEIFGAVRHQCHHADGTGGRGCDPSNGVQPLDVSSLRQLVAAGWSVLGSNHLHQ